MGPAHPPPPAWQAVGVLGSRQRVPAPEEETRRGRKLRARESEQPGLPRKGLHPPHLERPGPEGSASSWWRKEREVAQSCLTLWEPYQAPLSMGFSREEYWSGLPFPSPGDFPDPGIRTWVSRIAGRCFTF